MSTIVLPEDSPLAELATSFARSLRAARRSPRTVEVYLRAVMEYDRWAAAHDMPRDVSRIKRAHVEGYIEHEQDRNAPSTVSVRYVGLRRFLAWCEEEGEVASSPMAKIKPPKVPETMPPVPTEAQIEALIAACESGGVPTFRQRRDAALLLFMTDTGARRAEVAALTVADIDQEHLTAKIRHGKGDKPREVQYSTRTGQAIDRYLRLRKKHRMASSPALWLSGGPSGILSSDGIAETVARRSKIAGVTRPDGRLFTPHAARHFMADRAKRNGVSDDALSAQGGWTAGSTEMARYGRGNKVERSHAAFQKLFGDA